jgi:hypothetical protein
MNTKKITNNERLRQLVAGAGLTQAAALKLFNQGLGVRGLKESTWKGYFCDRESTRYRAFNDDLLAHAETTFGGARAKRIRTSTA